MKGRENREPEKGGYRLLSLIMLALPRSHLHHFSWFSAPPGLALPVESQPDYWRNELLHRGSDIERHPGPTCALPLRRRDVLVQDVLPTAAQHNDVAGSEFEGYLPPSSPLQPNVRQTSAGPKFCVLHLSAGPFKK